MPVAIELLNNGRVMLYTYSGHVTADDINHSIDEHTKHVLQTSYPVHVITDARRITRLPANLLRLLQRDIPLIRNVPQGISVVITQNRVIVTILNVLAKLIPGTDFRFVRTPEAAWQIINDALKNETSV